MAVTIYTNRAAIGDGTLWNTSGTYRLKTGNNSDLWVKVVDTGAVSPIAPTASTTSNFFSVGAITTKSSSGDTWIGTIRLSAGTSTTSTNQILTITYGSTTYTCNIRVNGTANGFSTNPTLASNFTYDDDNHAPITAWGVSKSANLFWAISTSNVVPPDSGWAASLDTFTGTIRNAGTYYLWYRMQSSNTTYNDVFPTLYGTSITCSKAVLTCTGSSHSITYSDAIPTLSISYSGWKGDDGTSDLTTRPTVSTTYTRGSNKGSYPTTVSGGSAINYSFSYVAGSITVAAKTATLAWGTLTWEYDKMAHSTTCGVSNLYGMDTCTVTMTGNSITNVGTATVTASSLSNSNYALPTTNTATLTITAREVTLTWGTTSWTYDGSTHSTTCTAGNLITGDSCAVTMTGNSVGKNVGSATVTASSLSNSNYKLPSSKTTTLYITAKTATFTWGTVTWTYDKTEHSTTCSVSNLVSGDTCTVTLSNNAITNVGTKTCTITGLSNSNYGLPGAGLDKILTVNAKEVGLTWGTITWTYDGDTHSTTCTATGVITGDTCTVSMTGNSIKNAGTTTVTASSLSNSNYKLPSANTNILTVNARTASLAWGTTSWTYDGSTHSTTCSVNNVVTGDTCTVTLSGNSVGANVGSATVTATALSNSNYILPSSKTKTISVTARAVTVTAANKSKTYGDANPTFTSSVTSGSLVSSGDLGTLSGTCSATTASTVGTYTITPSYTANSNYTVTTANGTLTVGVRTVTITFGSTKSWTYDGNAHSVTITVGNTVNSDSITATATGNSITNYGSSTVTVTGLSGTKASNYQLPSSGLTTTISITKRSVTLTAANKSKSYGDANPTLTSSITSGSLVNSGDLGTLGATTTATQASSVGTYTITPTYTANNNYTVTTANGTLTINKRTVTITFGTVTWVYDGSTHSTSITLGNIYGSDIVRTTVTGNSITHKGTSTCTVTALDNSNYQLPSSGTSTTLTITQATTVLTWSSYTTPMRVGETKPVSATTNFGTVSYSSSDTSIATISGTDISAIASGSCTITAAVATNSYGDWTAASITFTLVVGNGVKIFYYGEYKDAIPYVYFDGAWRKAIVYVHDGTTWKSC